jgi:phytoene dehydrogenase-like protein
MKRAVVVGSGPNGLAGAIKLAEAGLDVTVHEAEGTVGGGCRTAELTLPGFRHDVCAAVLPLARNSPAFTGLELEWIDPPAPAAHALDGDAVMLERTLEDTASGLGIDGPAYRNLVEPFVRAWPQRWSRWDLLRFRPSLARGLLSARAVARLFATGRARAFFAGHAAHSVLPLERAVSAGFGLVLCAAAHVDGWPFLRGGSQTLVDALAARLSSLGGAIVTSSRIDELPRAEVVLCDLAPSEFARVVGLPAYARSFRQAPAAFKLDWALAGPIPWTSDACRRAGTVHLGGRFAEIAGSERAAWEGHAPGTQPFAILTQSSLFDASRAPDGMHTAWAYCHVPLGWEGDASAAIESQVERFAPGFRELVLGRHVMTPRDFEAYNRNDIGGDVVGGANTLRQLVARPTARALPWRTPVRGVYLCSASTPPGGGVHGLCGLAAARVALRDLQ